MVISVISGLFNELDEFMLNFLYSIRIFFDRKDQYLLWNISDND